MTTSSPLTRRFVHWKASWTRKVVGICRAARRQHVGIYLVVDRRAVGHAVRPRRQARHQSRRLVLEAQRGARNHATGAGLCVGRERSHSYQTLLDAARLRRRTWPSVCALCVGRYGDVGHQAELAEAQGKVQPRAREKTQPAQLRLGYAQHGVEREVRNARTVKNDRRRLQRAIE